MSGGDLDRAVRARVAAAASARPDGGIPALRVAGYLYDLHERREGAGVRPGAYQLTGRLLTPGWGGLLYICPCPCGRLGSLRFRTTPAGPPPSWEWDGNEEAPTLSPSIHSVAAKGGCGWHGWLRSGVWTSV